MIMMYEESMKKIYSVLTNVSLICTGCFYSTTVGGLRSYENPKNVITAVPATDEEIWGATFKVIQVTHNFKSTNLYHVAIWFLTIKVSSIFVSYY